MIPQSQEQSTEYNGDLIITKDSEISTTNTFNSINITSNNSNDQQIIINKLKGAKLLCKTLIIKYFPAEYLYEILKYIEVLNTLEVNLHFGQCVSAQDSNMFLNIKNIKATSLIIFPQYKPMIHNQKLFISVSSEIKNITIDFNFASISKYNIFLLAQSQNTNITIENQDNLRHNVTICNLTTTNNANTKTTTEDELNKIIEDLNLKKSNTHGHDKPIMYCYDLWTNVIVIPTTQLSTPVISKPITQLSTPVISKPITQLPVIVTTEQAIKPKSYNSLYIIICIALMQTLFFVYFNDVNLKEENYINSEEEF